MTVTQTISTGLRIARRYWWVALLLFVASLVIAAAVGAPMRGAIADHLGKSTMSQHLVRGLDSNWLTEFQIAYEGFLRGFTTTIVAAAVLFLVLTVVLSAGAFEVFAQARRAGPSGAPAGMREFGHGIGRYFLRFLRLAVLASLLYFLVFLVWQHWAGKLLEKAFENSVTERGYFWLDLARTLVLLAKLAFINVLVQFTKADMVLHDHRSVLGSFGHAFGFVLRRLPRVAALTMGFGLMSLGAIAAYMVFARYFPQNSFLTVLIWLLVAQALLFVRWWIRTAFWAAAVALMPVAEPVREPELAQV